MAFVPPRRAGVLLSQVKSIVVRFCPFEANVESTRNFLACLHTKKAYASNTNCDLKTEVKHDGSEPVINVQFALRGENLIVCLRVFWAVVQAVEVKRDREKTGMPPVTVCLEAARWLTVVSN
ncbi:UNVERIFIED_CONTAM: hypothetical protein K2H54_037703 [Gekko kuhli]